MRVGSVDVGEGYFGFPDDMSGWSNASNQPENPLNRILGISVEIEMAFPRWAIGNLFAGKLGVGFEAGVLYDGNNVNFFTTTKSTSNETYTFGADVGGIYGIPNKGHPNSKINNSFLVGTGKEMGWNLGLPGYSIGGNPSGFAASDFKLHRFSAGIGFDTGSTWWNTRTKIY